LVVQGGPGFVWDDVEAAHEGWLSAGRPSRERHRLRVSSAGQDVCLVGSSESRHRLEPLQG
jgi:hypothetical protein